jgi:hypothetical protein
MECRQPTEFIRQLSLPAFKLILVNFFNQEKSIKGQPFEAIWHKD